MATDQERLIVSLEARIRDFERNFQKASKTANDKFAAIERRAKQSGDRLESTMAQAAGRVGNAFKTFGTAWGGGLGAAGIGALIGQFRQIANGIARIGDEARRAGVSLKAFQEWKYVAEQNRVGIDALIDGMKELSLRADEFIVTGKGSAAEAFRRLGYSADELKAKLTDPSALLLEIVDRLGQLDKAAQIRIADEIFGGTGGEQFVQLVDRGAASIRETINEAHRLGVVLDDDIIDKAAEVDRKFNQIANTVSSSLKRGIVEAVEALQSFIDRFNGFQAMRDAALEERLAELGRERLEVERQILEIKDKQRRGEGVGDGILGTFLGESTHLEALAERERRLEAIAAEEQAILRIIETRNKARQSTPSTPGSTFTPIASPEETKLNAYEREIQKLKERTAILQAETQARRNASGSLARQTAEAEKARVVQELLNAAQRAGITITDEMRSNIDTLATSYATAAADARALAQSQEEAARTAEELENSSKDAVKGFIADLRAGKSPIEALINALSRLADKLLDMALDGIWESIFGDGRGDNFFANVARAISGASGGTSYRSVQRMPLPVPDSTYSVANATAFIRQRAAQIGIDPDVALRVARSEGLGAGIWQSNVVRERHSGTLFRTVPTAKGRPRYGISGWHGQ